jgi:tetratricopeptide (TPR) repeat protein
MKMPKKTAWMGQGLDMHKTFRSTKDIPLMRNKNELKEYISAEKVLSNGKVYELNEDMNLETSFSGSTIKDKLKAFKSMNAYVTTNNKIIPDSLAIFTLKKEKFTDSEMVWINSLYNGYNSDKYFLIARNLAFDKEYDKTLLLCRYILSETPRHIDTKILTGRVNAWRGEREKSIAILRECVNQNPDYIDSYAALFDVFFWEGRHKDALELIETVKQNSSSASIIEDKIARAKKEANKAGITNSTKPILKQEATATLVIEE